ncbi:DNA repair protein [Vibrio methylphosphonaticus]|uniref:DNA repair protein n=1 Tax=Vibrio methylphosphonaticus TaxID=2946866 RepID=UPI00202A03BA|nr:DNA repair protein [Vibrio methylphosphonaticus]MCL9774338.1 DNA repair protein [Vibrio methylphosphonaticus]
MNIGLIIALVALLLVLVLGYNIMLQYKLKAEATRRQESARYVALIDATEELIGGASYLPYSKELMICLHNRILDALKNMHDLDPKNKHLAQRVESAQAQIQQLNENYEGNEATAFKVPTSDKQAIVMLKLVKRLRDTIRTEHNKGRIETQAYMVENGRLETIQIRINIENVVKRAHESIAKGQPGTAMQLLKKGIDALSSKNDNYSIQAKEKLTEILEQLQNSRQAKADEQQQQQASRERDNDMDALFGEKKKW